MINVIYGKKGMGKTKILVENANNFAEQSSGDVVFIDDSNQLMYDLKRKIRFINVADFPVEGSTAFLGFLCGMISQDYDIDGVFIDGLTYIVKERTENLKEFFTGLKKLASKYNVTFNISINGDNEEMPEFLKEFIA